MEYLLDRNIAVCRPPIKLRGLCLFLKKRPGIDLYEVFATVEPSLVNLHSSGNVNDSIVVCVRYSTNVFILLQEPMQEWLGRLFASIIYGQW